MALYGSASVNLSPLLFKGNRNSIGVNIIIHNDVSNSMYLPPNGWTNYLVSRPGISGQANISAASTISMFYDGFFIEKLQDYLLFKKIGDKGATQPNLYAYFDTNTRIGPAFSVTNNSSTLNISNTFIKGDSTGTATRSTWRNNYINVGGPYNTNSEAEYLNRASTITTGGTNRFVGISGNQISEDVHGNLWSISYFGSTSNTISSGESGTIGKILKDRTRRGLPTFVITASNEQENAPPNMLGVPVETKLNVGYTTDRELYSKPGLHGVRFDHYFDDDGTGSVYNAAPSGTESQYNSGAGTGEVENWFNNIAQFLPEGSISGVRDENTGIGSTTSIRIENFPLQEDDIQDYSFMWIGYFKPNVSGNWKFRTNSNEKSCLWIDSDTDITNNTVYTVSGWKYSNAKVQNTASRTANQLIDVISADVPLTAGRYYPIRIIFGNRPGESQSGSSPTNLSRITVYYDPPGSGSSNQTTDGTNLLFGADDIWKTGSEFFPPKIVDVTKTLEQEVIDRSYRIISLSSYKQPEGDPDYDGVFFNKDGTYRYITLQSDGNYTQQPSLIAPNWTLGNYYNKVGFAISSTHVNNTGAAGAGASIFVDKYNSYYIATVNSLQKGVGYRIGDRISIAGTSLAENTPANDLVLEVSQVDPTIYNDQISLNPTNVRNNYTVPTAPAAPNSARFTVKKNVGNVLAYTIAMPNGGTGYSQNDRLRIPGSSLSGTAGVNDLDILVTSVNGSGTIQTYSIGYLGVGAPNPTNYIDYTVAPSYKPISVTGVAYSTTGIASVGYTTSLIAGIAFTTANISGIAYTTASVVSIAFTSKTIGNITYPSQKGAIINKAPGNGTLVIVDTIDPHGLNNNDFVTIDASGDANLDNLTFQITRINPISFSLNGTDSFNANISNQTILYIDSTTNSTDLARVECIGHGFNNGDIIDITGSSNSLFNNRFTITTFGDPDNFDLRGTATSPYYESDIPASSDGTATLKADATLTLSSSNIAYTTGSSVRVQGSNPTTFNDTDFTIRQYTPTTYRLEGSSTATYGNLTNTTGGIVGLNNAPATVITSGHAFVTGQSVAIQNSSADFNGNYTVSVYSSTRFGLNGKINPTNYTVTTNTGIAGLRNSPPIFTTKTDHPFATGDSVRLQDCTNAFFNNFDYTITVYSPTSFGASNASVQNPSNFATAVVTTTPTQNNGLLGLRNVGVVVETTTNHNFIGGESVNIYNTTLTNTFSGNRTIQTIISPTRFTLVSTANTTDYRPRAVGGKVALRNLGAIVTTNTNHTLTSGMTVNITGLLNPSLIDSEFNGTRTVQSIISPTRFSLTGTSGTTNYDNTASPGTLGSSLVITGGAGSSAQLVIRRRFDGVYQVSTVSIPGSGYRVNDQLIVTGINLGGANVTNDATITVTAVTQNTDTLSPNYDLIAGKIVSASITGTADVELDYSDNTGALIQFTPTVVPGSGSGSQWTVERNGTTTYVVSRNAGGSNYYVNDKILIRGNNLGGSTTANDLLITVTGVNASGTILSTSGYTFSGTAALGAPISVTGLTTVTTLPTQFSRPYNLEVDGGSLDQRHPTLELADLTKGGLFKIDRVYVALANSLTVGNVDTIAGISSVDRRESFAAALADFINTNR